MSHLVPVNMAKIRGDSGEDPKRRKERWGWGGTDTSGETTCYSYPVYCSSQAALMTEKPKRRKPLMEPKEIPTRPPKKFEVTPNAFPSLWTSGNSHFPEPVYFRMGILQLSQIVIPKHEFWIYKDSRRSVEQNPLIKATVQGANPSDKSPKPASPKILPSGLPIFASLEVFFFVNICTICLSLLRLYVSRRINFEEIQKIDFGETGSSNMAVRESGTHAVASEIASHQEFFILNCGGQEYLRGCEVIHPLGRNLRSRF
ncbi:hypothetical protein Aperf_G00000096675 [Anoplocephala perfoliata]